jgi:predicted ABC-type ATPase
LHLFFLWIPDPELAVARIRERVSEGGHNVPVADVRRRFIRGIRNFFEIYEPIFNSWMLFDNSQEKPVLIAKRRNGHKEVFNEKSFVLFRKAAGY